MLSMITTQALEPAPVAGSGARRMTGAPARLVLFGALLGAAYGAAAAVGAAVDLGRPPASGHAGSMAALRSTALGLGVSDDRYSLTPATFVATPGTPTSLRFRITDLTGRIVRSGFELEAQRKLHLILVRRDLRGYQHLHPVQASDGTWSAPATVPGAGVYRVFADFQIDGQKHVLGGDLTVPGTYAPGVLPAPSPLATADAYQVRLTTPAPRARHEVDLEFAVSRGGKPVTRVQPYLGALGHLVALREGDLGYLHIHQYARAETAGVLPFAGTFPSPGIYRLFLQFQTNGTVHTAGFSVKVAA
jgi:hypothetical protein